MHARFEALSNGAYVGPAKVRTTIVLSRMEGDVKRTVYTQLLLDG